MKSENTRNGSKKVLMIAYGFPPIAYAGTHRTLRFCKYLPDHGWMPTVLTIKEDKYIHNDFNLLKKIPREVKIYRTSNIDMWRPLWKSYSETSKLKTQEGFKALIGKFLANVQSVLLYILSIPDHMLFWVPFAVREAISLIKHESFDIIYTTSPPHSEHLAGVILSKICKKPWIVDFRDPIVDNFCLQNLPAFPRLINQVLERTIVKNAHKIILVSDVHHACMTERYPAFKDKFIVIKNGFDPEQFKVLEACSFDRFTILYSGSLYGSITPDFFLKGFTQWIEGKGQAVRDDVQALFYGLGFRKVEALSKILGVEDVVKSFEFVPQDEIIKKQKGADLLLLIIASDEKSKGVVSSKIFEYLASGSPILGIVPDGDALKVLSACRSYYHVVEDDYASLKSALDAAYESYRRKKLNPLDETAAARHIEESLFNGKTQVKDLARLFNETLYQNERLAS